MSKKIDRTGETNVSNEGCIMKIVEYNSNKDVIIEFQDKHKYRFEILRQEYNWSDNEKLTLDKDILHKDNKIYSLENCVLVPQWINSLFTKNNAKRGNYPVGVCYRKKVKNIKLFVMSMEN